MTDLASFYRARLDRLDERQHDAELHIMETVEVPGRGLLHIVANPGLAEPADLIGREVVADGQRLRVTAVETIAVARPYPPRLPIGLVLAVSWPEEKPVLPVTGEVEGHEVG